MDVCSACVRSFVFSCLVDTCRCLRRSDEKVSRGKVTLGFVGFGVNSILIQELWCVKVFNKCNVLLLTTSAFVRICSFSGI